MNQRTGVAIVLMILFAVTANAAEPYNYGDLWRSWNISAREAYIEGVVDGIFEAFYETMTTVAPGKKFSGTAIPADVKIVEDKLFVRYTRDQLQNVITDLYKDPANSYIRTLQMLFLARDKIEGKNIEKDVMEARKKTMNDHRMLEEMRKTNRID